MLTKSYQKLRPGEKYVPRFKHFFNDLAYNLCVCF